MDNLQPQPAQPITPTIWEANPKLKTLLLVLIFVFLFSGLGLVVFAQWSNSYRQKVYEETQAGLPKHKAPAAANLKTYASQSLNLQFEFPPNITVSESNGIIILNHNIPFENHGACDMIGDEKVYPTLNDFNATIQIESGTVAQTVKKLSPYMTAENFSGNTLKLSPGFIDDAQIGSLKGFSILEGVEGCGHIIYYFPMENNRTLVIVKDNVQMLSGIVTSGVREQILKVPGVITPEESDKIFKQIVNSLQISAVGDITGWKTYKNEQYGFEFQYPEGSLNDNPADNFVPNQYDQSIMKVSVFGTLEGRPDAIFYSVTVYNSSVDLIIKNLKKTYTGVTLNIEDDNFQGLGAKIISYTEGNQKLPVGVYITKGAYVYGIEGLVFERILPTFKFTK